MKVFDAHAFHELTTFMLHSQATFIGCRCEHHELSHVKVRSPTKVLPQPQRIPSNDHIVLILPSILLFPLPYEGRLIIGQYDQVAGGPQ